ncbi:magnesium chelatase subunit D [Tabrizicola sp.]|uniref:magnesium chelatase subunit D n=1 Tax=Tabrizicola sp. TaxID=2005166 RepID=UPI003D2DB297
MSDPLSPWERAEAAIAALAVDPAGLRGLWLRARSGPLRDRVVQALAALPLPQRRLHPGVDDATLFGGVDLSATLAQGQLVRSAGILASPAAIVLTMAERCPAGLAARLARVLDEPGFCLIALDEGAEPDEALAPALADRLALFLDLDGIPSADAFPLVLEPQALAEARARLGDVRIDPKAVETLTRLAAAMGIASLRAPLLTLATARALAAWRGEATPGEDTLRHAAELTLAHRGMLPEASEPDAAPPPPPEPNEPDSAEAESRQSADTPPEEMLLDAIRAALPPDLLARLAVARAARAAKGSGGSGDARKGNHRGRPLPPRPGTPGSGKRIDLVATLRAAAPWQPLRRKTALVDKPGLHIRQSDLRLKRYVETSDRVLIFTVDASGSSALARLAEAKGAVELLLAQAYARRDHVALIAFRGQSAELLLPPTRSLVQTKRRLAGLPGGGGTPLAAGLQLALLTALQTRARGMTPTIALLTDGRGNIALDGSPSRAEAEADSQRLALALRNAQVPTLVIDIATRPQPALRDLAARLDAPYLPLPRADAHRLSAVLGAALEG